MWECLSDSIERVQKRALRIIFPVLHNQEALATTGCVSLHTKRMELCSKLFTKIKELKSRLCHLVPPTRSQAHGRSLRNKDRPYLTSCKTERFKWLRNTAIRTKVRKVRQVYTISRLQSRSQRTSEH